MKKRTRLVVLLILLILISTSCGMQSKEEKLLDPENPITITIWSYYNGSVKVKFDALVTEFNETVGAEKGIAVEAQSYGDVNELAEAVFESANKEIGAMPMPDIFAAYPDNAFRIDQVSELVDLNTYFSDDDLGEIRNEFLTEGMFGEDQALKILPIAKSSEILYLNKTYWDAFAAETGAELDSLKTWEGLAKTAKQYYDYSGGKAFFSIDANANFMLVSSIQQGEELYSYHGDTASLNLSRDHAYRIWQNYYIPYLNGYFEKSGRFSSDDAKTGVIAAYIGSTAGASYFPEEVEANGVSTPIEVIALPYPCYQDAAKYAVQQGAGMCIAKSDPSHEYAASIFLKWFIDVPQNTKFAAATAYLPVKSKALDADLILAELENENRNNVAVRKSIETTINMFKDYSLYGNRAFRGSYEVRKVLETSLSEFVKKDLEVVNERVNNGENRQAVITELTSEDHFNDWYEEFCKDVQELLSKS